MLKQDLASPKNTDATYMNLGVELDLDYINKRYNGLSKKKIKF